MQVEYALEDYYACVEEAKQFLIQAHYEEVGLGRVGIELNPDYEALEASHKNGALRIVTARVDGKLVGYWSGFVRGHLNYKHEKMAFTHIYFILKEHRGRCARGMFKFLHSVLKSEGVTRLHNRAKLEDINSAGRFLQLMGYELEEYGYSISL
jgi:hypothetical protein